MQMVFKQLGGDPKKIRIDNMKTAVVKPRRNGTEAVFTNEFIQFANFFGFEPQACNAYAGHEKGNVANKVGYLRYSCITTASLSIDLGDFTELLDVVLVCGGDSDS